jgi:hypothetical protein
VLQTNDRHVTVVGQNGNPDFSEIPNAWARRIPQSACQAGGSANTAVASAYASDGRAECARGRGELRPEDEVVATAWLSNEAALHLARLG